MTRAQERPVKVGVLALQGAFIEHIHVLTRTLGVDAVPIRTVDQLRDPALDALIIPGVQPGSGNSTAIGSCHDAAPTQAGRALPWP